MEEVIKDRCEIIRKCELCHEMIKANEDEFTIKDKNSTKFYVLCKKCFKYKEKSKNIKLLTYFKWNRDEEMDREYI